MSATPKPPRSKLDLYGNFAFGALVLVVYSEFLHARQIDGTLWQITATFLLGGAYTVIGVLGVGKSDGRRPWLRALYYPTQCAITTAMLLITPLRGFSGLIVMPVVSVAVLDLSWPWASLVVAEQFAACVASIWIPYGISVVPQAATNYGIAIVFTVVFSVVTRSALSARERAEKLSTELGAANEQLRRFAAQADELATTRERNRLAREIHDGLGHYLTTINIQLEAARAVFATSPAQAAASLENAVRLSREALADVRQSVGTLRADTPRPPLPVAIETAARNLSLPATVHIEGDPRPLSPAIEHALFRAAQEGLTNVSKHAASTHVDVALDFRASDRVTLSIADDGRGCPAGGSSHGFGLRGLRERVEVLGGTLTAANRPAGGFLLQIALPA